MYIPQQFEETRLDVLHELIRSRPLATLVTIGAAGIEANHIPLVLSGVPTPLGVLHGHVARANPLWRDHPAETDVLAIFHGAESYITPSWYAAKAETGKVVPTWNYVTVHVRGKLRVIDDPAWVKGVMETLTVLNESAFEHPWAVSDAPEEFTNQLLLNVVGVEIAISEIKGKWKVSQNRPEVDRRVISKELTNRGQDEMGRLVMSRLTNET